MAQNNDNSGAAVGFALVVTAIWFFMAAVFAIAAFFAFILTIMSIMAWNKPLTFGKNTITTEEARSFIKHGLAGAFLLPAFALFCGFFLQWPIRDEAWIYIVVAGYTGGSVGLLLIEAQQEEEKAKAAAAAQFYLQAQVIEPASQAARPIAPLREQPSSRFATWDDEEKRS